MSPEALRLVIIIGHIVMAIGWTGLGYYLGRPSRSLRRRETIRIGAAMELSHMMKAAAQMGKDTVAVDHRLGLRLCGVEPPEKEGPIVIEWPGSGIRH